MARKNPRKPRKRATLARHRNGAHRRNAWGTPQWLLERIRTHVFHGPIQLDPATEPHNPTKAIRFYTICENGLHQSWADRTFCNPPYGSELPEWAKKTLEEAALGHRIVLLVPARPDSRHAQRLLHAATDVLFFSGRLRHDSFDGFQQKHGPEYAHMLLAFNCSLRGLADLGWLANGYDVDDEEAVA